MGGPAGRNERLSRFSPSREEDSCLPLKQAVPPTSSPSSPGILPPFSNSLTLSSFLLRGLAVSLITRKINFAERKRRETGGEEEGKHTFFLSPTRRIQQLLQLRKENFVGRRPSGHAN